MVVILLFPLPTNTLNGCDEIHESDKCPKSVQSNKLSKPPTKIPSANKALFHSYNEKPNYLFTGIKGSSHRPLASNSVNHRNSNINPVQSNLFNRAGDINQGGTWEESKCHVQINDQSKILNNIKQNDVFSKRQRPSYSPYYVQQLNFKVENAVNGRNETKTNYEYFKHPKHLCIESNASKGSLPLKNVQQKFINNTGLDVETSNHNASFHLNNNNVTLNQLKTNFRNFHALAPAYRTIEEGNNFTNFNRNNIFYDGVSNASNTTFGSDSPQYDTHYITRVNFYELNNSQVDIDSKPESDVPLVDAGVHSEEELNKKKTTELCPKKQNEIKVKRHIVFEDEKIIDDSNTKGKHNIIEDAEKQKTEIKVDKHLDIPDEKSKNRIVLLKKTEDPITSRINTRKNDEKLDSVPSLNKRNFTHQILGEDADNLLDITVKDLAEIGNKGYENVSNYQTGNVEKYFLKSKKSHDVGAIDRTSVNVNENHYSTIDKDRDKCFANAYGKISSEKVADSDDDVDIKTCLGNEDFWIRTNGGVSDIKSENRGKETEENLVQLAVNGTISNSAMRYVASPLKYEKNDSFEGIGAPENLSDKLRGQKKLHQRTLLQLQKDRKDALTKRPLDFDIEEETRKGETMKWLESHFGSDSNTSVESNFENLDTKPMKTYFNITIKSNPSELPKAAETPMAHRKSSVSFGKYVSCDDITDRQKHGVWKHDFPATHKKSNIYLNRLPIEQLKTLPNAKDKTTMEKYQSANDLVEVRYNLQERPKPPERRKHMRRNVSRQDEEKPDEAEYLPLLKDCKISNAEQNNSLNRSHFGRVVLKDNAVQQTFLSPNQRSSEVQPTFDFNGMSKVPNSQPKKTKVSNVIGRSFRKIVERFRAAGSDKKIRKSRSKSRDKTISNAEADVSTQTYQQYNVIDGHIIGDSTVDGNCNHFLEKFSIDSSSKTKPRVVSNVMQSLTKQNKPIVPRKQYYLGQNPYPSQKEDNVHREYYNKPQVNKTFSHPKAPNAYNSLEKTMRNFRITESMPHLSRMESRTSHTLPRKADENNKLIFETPSERKQSIKISPSFLSYNINDIYLDEEEPPIMKPITHFPIPLNRSKSLNLNAFVESEEVGLPRNRYNNKLHSYSKSTIPEDNVMESLKSPSIVNLINRSQMELARFEPIYAKPNYSKKL